MSVAAACSYATNFFGTNNQMWCMLPHGAEKRHIHNLVRFVNNDAQRSLLHGLKQKRRARTRHLRRRFSPASRRPRSENWSFPIHERRSLDPLQDRPLTGGMTAQTAAARQWPRQEECTIAATKSTRRRRLPRNYRGDVQTAPTASLTSRSARFAVPMPKRSATVSRSSSVMSPVLPFTERTCGFDQASKSLSSAEK